MTSGRASMLVTPKKKKKKKKKKVCTHRSIRWKNEGERGV